MKFDDLDERMRVFETAADQRVLPGIHMVARIDGRGFTRLTKEVHAFEAPFDQRFRDLMVHTTTHLMDCGFRVLYGYTQSDEISLLFHRDETAFGRKLRKYDSVLAGEASAAFSVALGAHGAFDCRISQLPLKEHVVEYFRWRQEDATRNALSGHCYWMLRKSGVGAREATSRLQGIGVAAKNELLHANGINFNDLPAWQKRGVGLYWESIEKVAENLKTGEEVRVQRRRLAPDYEIPMKDAYDAFILGFIEEEAPRQPPDAS